VHSFRSGLFLGDNERIGVVAGGIGRGYLQALQPGGIHAPLEDSLFVDGELPPGSADGGVLVRLTRETHFHLVRTVNGGGLLPGYYELGRLSVYRERPLRGPLAHEAVSVEEYLRAVIPVAQPQLAVDGLFRDFRLFGDVLAVYFQ